MLKIRQDIRPTTASWPQKIIELNELPKKYHQFLQNWISSGMPISNITYIPLVHKYKKDSEYVIAWFKDEVILLISTGNDIEKTVISKKNMAWIDYYIQLLNCTVVITINENGKTFTKKFHYNKVKEELIIPSLNIMLGNSADYELNVFLLKNLSIENLSDDSYGMFNLSKLCYRFDTEILNYYWARGKHYSILKKQKEDPEYFIAYMKKGIVYISTNFYGIKVVYMPWDCLDKIYFTDKFESNYNFRIISGEPKTFSAIVLCTRYEIQYVIPVLEEKILESKNFAKFIQEQLENNISFV